MVVTPNIQWIDFLYDNYFKVLFINNEPKLDVFCLENCRNILFGKINDEKSLFCYFFFKKLELNE